MDGSLSATAAGDTPGFQSWLGQRNLIEMFQFLIGIGWSALQENDDPQDHDRQRISVKKKTIF